MNILIPTKNHTATAMLTLLPQERKGSKMFSGMQTCMTQGFRAQFPQAYDLILQSLRLISEVYPHGADYLQVFEYADEHRKVRFWCINDGNAIMFLMPDEY